MKTLPFEEKGKLYLNIIYIFKKIYNSDDNLLILNNVDLLEHVIIRDLKASLVESQVFA